MDMVDNGLDGEIDGMDADFAMRIKEVTLAALDRITREVKRFTESVSEVGPWANGGPEDLFDAGEEDNPVNEDGWANVNILGTYERSMLDGGPCYEH